MARNTPKTPPEKRSPLTVLLDGILVFLALAGSLFSFSTAFSLQVRTLPLLLGCGLCALAVLASLSLPRFRWAPPIVIALGWAWALRELWDTLALGEISLRCSVVNTVVASLGTGQAIRPIAELPDSVWQDACTALVLMAAVPLALLLGLSIMRARSFWLTALLCLPFVAAPLAISITPAWLPLMAVLVCWGTLALPSLSVRSGRKRYDQLRLVSLPVCTLALALLTAAMPRAAYQRPAWADKAHDEILNWASRVSDEYFPSVHVFNGGMALDQEVDLSSAGPLRYTNRNVLEVRSSDLRGRIYLRGFSSAVYDGKSWGPLEDEAYRLLGRYAHDSSSIFTWNPRGEQGEGLVNAAGMAQDPAPYLMMELNGFQPMNFPAMAERDTYPDHPYAKVTVRNIGATPGYVYVPYHILTTPEELSGAWFVQDAYVAAEKGVDSHTLYIMPNCSPGSGSALPYGSDASVAQRDYAAFVHSAYTGVPDALYEVLMEWVINIFRDPEHYLPDGAENIHYRVLYGAHIPTNEFSGWMGHSAGIVLDSLAYLYKYNPDTPATPEGEDFVEYFLTESHEGYCMHFASAATLLLRTLGYPARYVSGYVADIPASGRTLVPDANAHAWVEVYIDGYGWHPIEVTPAYAGGEPGVSGGALQTEATPAPTRTPTPSRNPLQTPRPSATPKPAEEEDEALDPRIFGIGAAVLLAAALPFLWRALARSVRRRRFAGADTNRAVIDMYRYLTRLSRRGGSIPEDANTLAEKAKFSQHTLTEDERSTMAALTQREAESLDAGLSLVKRLLLRYWFGLF